MKKKICYVDEDGRYGGPQARMLELEKNINKKEFTIYFLIPEKLNIFNKILSKINANYKEIPLTRLSNNLKTIAKYIFLFPYETLILINNFKKNKYNIIQANGAPHFKTILAAKICNIPSIWIVEDTYSPKIILFIFRILAKKCECKVVYKSKKVHDYYLKNSNFKKKNLYKIMSPINSRFFKRKKPYKNNKKLIISTISGIVPVKGVEDFLYVAKKILTRFNHVTFIFVGGKIDTQIFYFNKMMKIYNSFNKKKKKKIKFIGMQKNVKKILENSDIFLCTSRSEGGPITVWEAMSMKVPVVSTKVGGTPEIILNGYNGYLCNISNINQIYKSLVSLIKNSRLRNDFSKHSRKIITNKIDSRIITKKYEKLYHSINV